MKRNSLIQELGYDELFQSSCEVSFVLKQLVMHGMLQRYEKLRPQATANPQAPSNVKAA
jgi:hypothetical protein